MCHFAILFRGYANSIGVLADSTGVYFRCIGDCGIHRNDDAYCIGDGFVSANDGSYSIGDCGLRRNDGLYCGKDINLRFNLCETSSEGEAKPPGLLLLKLL
jgi:hypothetical protein